MQFEELPKNIQESMFSERIDKILDEIRKKAGIYDETLLPSIYYGLITKEIPAFDFVNSLAESGLGVKIAASVAKAIKERILESERYPLFKWGVDISDIKVSEAPDIETLGLEEFNKSQEKKITPEILEENFQINIPIIKSEKEETKTQPSLGNINLTYQTERQKENQQPFVLQEKPTLETSEQKPNKAFSVFSLNQIGFFKNKKTPSQDFPETVRAQIETPKETKQKEVKRVVHYSESQTPLAPWERGGEFLKPETISSDNLKEMANKEEKESGKILPTPPQPKNEEIFFSQEGTTNQIKGPLLEKNIIDLRNIEKDK